jgi:hypothetical protein
MQTTRPKVSTNVNGLHLSETLHAAVKSAASERAVTMLELVQRVLLTDADILAAYLRIQERRATDGR